MWLGHGTSLRKSDGGCFFCLRCYNKYHRPRNLNHIYCSQFQRLGQIKVPAELSKKTLGPSLGLRPLSERLPLSRALRVIQDTKCTCWRNTNSQLNSGPRPNSYLKPPPSQVHFEPRIPESSTKL